MVAVVAATASPMVLAAVIVFIHVSSVSCIYCDDKLRNQHDSISNKWIIFASNIRTTVRSNTTALFPLSLSRPLCHFLCCVFDRQETRSRAPYMVSTYCSQTCIEYRVNFLHPHFHRNRSFPFLFLMASFIYRISSPILLAIRCVFFVLSFSCFLGGGVCVFFPAPRAFPIPGGFLTDFSDSIICDYNRRAELVWCPTICVPYSNYICIFWILLGDGIDTI